MSSKTRSIINIVIGGLILFSGIRGLMGIGSKGFIPHELYVVFGLFSIGYGIWKMAGTNGESEDKK